MHKKIIKNPGHRFNSCAYYYYYFDFWDLTSNKSDEILSETFLIAKYSKKKYMFQRKRVERDRQTCWMAERSETEAAENNNNNNTGRQTRKRAQLYKGDTARSPSLSTNGVNELKSLVPTRRYTNTTQLTTLPVCCETKHGIFVWCIPVAHRDLNICLLAGGNAERGIRF